MRSHMSRLLCLCHKCEHSYAYVYAYACVTSVNQPVLSWTKWNAFSLNGWWMFEIIVFAQLIRATEDIISDQYMKNKQIFLARSPLYKIAG